MGDTYRPRRAAGDGDRSEVSHPPSHDQYNNSRGESYRPQSPSRNRGFSFRGAADNYRAPDPPRSNFTFEARSDIQAPRFPQEQPRQRPNRQPARHNQKQGGYNGPRGKARFGGQQGRRFGPKPAHSRQLLTRSDRETTPEQLAGMKSDSQPRYAEYVSSDEEESDPNENSDGDSDGDGDGDGDSGNGLSRKRRKTEDTVEPARPKWSNPDPYSVLPPTDLGIGPKKDIVHTIRKAKVEVTAKTDGANAVKENADFISFGFEEGDEDVEDAEDGEMVEDDPSDMDAPPPPPAGFVMPTDEELMEDYGRDFDNKKRKRGAETSFGLGDVIPDWQTKPGQNPTPWYRSDLDFTPDLPLRLHKEVLDFYDYVKPYRHEENIRLDLIFRIEQAVRNWVHARGLDVEICSFGSFASSLYLPVADMDLVAVSAQFLATGEKKFCQSKNKLFQIGHHLERCGIIRENSLSVIPGARVPIIKFADRATGIKVDISFENASGLRANDTVKQWKQQYPQMPILVAFVKQFLAMRNLHEVPNGGIGGFTIICLVVHLLQHAQPSSDEYADCGDLLIRFLNLYGNKFDVRMEGIKFQPPGIFSKAKYRGNARMNPDRLTIIDPNDASNDVSGGSKHINAVLQCFSTARTKILQCLEEMRRGRKGPSSILECVLGGDYRSFDEQRDLLDRIDMEHRRALEAPPPPPATNTYLAPPPAAWYRYADDRQPAPANPYDSQYPTPAYPAQAESAHKPATNRKQTHPASQSNKAAKKAQSPTRRQKPAPKQAKQSKPTPNEANGVGKKGKSKGKRKEKKSKKQQQQQKKGRTNGA